MTKQRRSVRPVRPDRANPEPRPPKPLQVHETGILVLPPSMTVGELAQILRVNPADIINPLIRSGVFATMNQGIDRETAALIATELGFNVAEPEPEEVEEAPTEAPRLRLRQPSRSSSKSRRPQRLRRAHRSLPSWGTWTTGRRASSTRYEKRPWPRGNAAESRSTSARVW